MKNKIDFKLVNLALIALIIFLLFQTSSLWIGVINKFFQILTPFIIAFVIAYAMYPLLKYLQSKKVPKGLAIFLIIALLLGIFGFIIFLVVPLLFNQSISSFGAIIDFVEEMSNKYNFDLGPLQKTLTDSFNDIIFNVGKYVSNGAINLINVSLSFLANAFLCITAAIYFLIDMESIRKNIKSYLMKKSLKSFKYVELLDKEMKSYLSGFLQIMIISLFEYTIIYTIIGHPNAVLLGFLALISNLIPYFGGMVTNVIAGITAFVISPALFIRTVITFLVLSVVDGNIIGPIVYGKSNKVKPIIVILSITAGGILLGLKGVIISFPLAIIIIATFKFFKEDINYKLDDMKENKKKTK